MEDVDEIDDDGGCEVCGGWRSGHRVFENRRTARGGFYTVECV